MSNAAPRSTKPDETPPLSPPVLERGAVLSFEARVLRIDGPWVTFTILGEQLRVLRSRVEKEFNP